MRYTREDLLYMIDAALADRREDAEFPVSEEELQRREKTLKSQEMPDIMEDLFRRVYSNTPEEEERLMKTAACYPLETLGLSARSYNALVNCASPRIRTVADLLRLSFADLRKIRNLGRRSIGEIDEAQHMFTEKFKRGEL